MPQRQAGCHGTGCARSAHHVPDCSLHGRHRGVGKVVDEDASLNLVVDAAAGAVGVDDIDVGRFEARLFKRTAMASPDPLQDQALSGGWRRC